MIKFAAAVCSIAAMIFIGQFLWGFQEAANEKRAAEKARFDQIVLERTKRIANGAWK